MQECPLSSEWIFRTISWYNMRPLFKPLLERMLGCTNGKEIRLMLEALSGMTHKWSNDYGMMDADLLEGHKLKDFYKKLPTDISLKELQKVENLLPAPLTMTKRRYFESLNKRTLERRLRSATFEDREQLSEVVWLFEATVNSMNDQEFLLGKIEMYLLTSKARVEVEHAESLMRTYTAKGRINPNIYKHIIKPHIMQHRLKDLPSLVSTLKFVVCSECDDQALLRTIYELIDNQYKPGAIKDSETLYTLHLYTHYLRTQGYQIRLKERLEQELNNFCTQRSEGRNSLNTLVFKSKETNDTVMRSKSRYMSPCLNSRQQFADFEPTRNSFFEERFKNKLKKLDLHHMHLIEKPVVCCFELDYCLRDAKGRKRELYDVEVQGIQYVFASGRMKREYEIRDELLQHYGFKVVHIDYNSIISYNKLTEDVLLNTKVTRVAS